MAQSHHRERPPDPEWHETGPVFADPTGNRRRLMRVLGAAASIFLVGALVIAGIGLFGGPDTPFSMFGAPAGTGGGRGNAEPSPGASSGLGSGGNSGPARSAKPSPSASADQSPARRPGSSPSPTNKAGNTPPGQNRSKKPHHSPPGRGL